MEWMREVEGSGGDEWGDGEGGRSDRCRLRGGGSSSDVSAGRFREEEAGPGRGWSGSVGEGTGDLFAG